MSQELDVDKFTAIVVETLEDASFVFADPDPEADACGPQLVQVELPFTGKRVGAVVFAQYSWAWSRDRCQLARCRSRW